MDNLSANEIGIIIGLVGIIVGIIGICVTLIVVQSIRNFFSDKKFIAALLIMLILCILYFVPKTVIDYVRTTKQQSEEVNKQKSITEDALPLKPPDTKPSKEPTPSSSYEKVTPPSETVTPPSKNDSKSTQIDDPEEARRQEWLRQVENKDKYKFTSE